MELFHIHSSDMFGRNIYSCAALMNHNSEEQGNRNEVNKINGETLVAFQNQEKYSSCSFFK